MNPLGKISLILSLSCFLLTLGFKAALGGWMPFMFFGFGFGLFFLLFAIAVNLNYFKTLISSKSMHFLTKSTLTMALTVLLLTALNYIFSQQTLFFDLTENKIHSLSPFTKDLIGSLDEDINFYYFHIENKRVQGYKKLVRKEIQKYKALSSKIHFESHSVFKRPDLAKKFGVGDEESSLFVKSKDRIQRIYELEERAFVNALLKLTKPPKKLYFLELKDERSIEVHSTFGLMNLKQQLERLHYQVDRISSLEKLPENMAVLALVGSRKPFSKKEREQLNLYLQKGGSLLVALDPGEDHNLNPLLETYGVRVDNNFIFSDQAQTGQSRLLVLTHKGKQPHKLNQGLREGQNPLFFISSSVSVPDKNSDSNSHKNPMEKSDSSLKDSLKKEELASSHNLPTGKTPKTLKVTPLLEHLPTSKGHKDIDPSSPVMSKGGLWASVISEGQWENENFRLVVVGDSDFLTNQFYSQEANFDFAFNLFSYLSQDEDLLKIKTILPKTTYLILTQTQMNHYFIFFILPFPFLFFILAIFFKLRRFF